MKSYQWHRIAVLVLGLALLTGLTGCATGGGGSQGSRGSLSGAVAESADEKEEEAEGRGQGRTRTKGDSSTSDNKDDYQDYYTDEDSDEGGSWLAGLVWGLFTGGDDDEYEDKYAPGSADKDEEENKYTRRNLIFWYSRSHLAGDVIQGFSTGTLAYSEFSGPQLRYHAGLYFGEGTLGGQENIQEGISRLTEFGLVIGFRQYFTDDQTFMGFYYLAELDLGVMSWSYVNPIEAPAEDGGIEYISDDDILVITPCIGLGTSLVQTKVIHLGASLSYGVMVPVGKTFQEFENDLFQVVGEFTLKLEASIFF